jgi:excisionase family DNA binding protein
MIAGVYILQAANGLVKIGQSIHVNKRVSLIRSGSPLPVALLHVVETDQAGDLERALHARFASRRHHGEWFALTPDDILEIRTYPVPSPRAATDGLTVKQVAERLQIGEVTVLRWLRSGKLAGIKLGGNRIGWRVPESEVARLERGSPTPPRAELRATAERLGLGGIAAGIAP